MQKFSLLLESHPLYGLLGGCGRPCESIAVLCGCVCVKRNRRKQATSEVFLTILLVECAAVVHWLDEKNCPPLYTSCFFSVSSGYFLCVLLFLARMCVVQGSYWSIWRTHFYCHSALCVELHLVIFLVLLQSMSMDFLFGPSARSSVQYVSVQFHFYYIKISS